MTRATDFTQDEGELLFDVPFIVAGTSLAVIQVSALALPDCERYQQAIP